MNKGLVTILIIVVLALGGGGAYYLYKKANQKTETATQTSTTQQQSAENMSTTGHADDNSTASTSQTNSVTIQNFAFSPAHITVKKGTTVTWTNQDSAAHNVTSNQSGGPKSGTLEKGQTFSFKFDTTGTFDYICSIHPSMKGTVTVTE